MTCVCVSIYTDINNSLSLYIYIYIRDILYTHDNVCDTCIYIYIYVYISMTYNIIYTHDNVCVMFRPLRGSDNYISIVELPPRQCKDGLRPAPYC